MEHLKLQIHDGIAVVTFCNPPQNRMGLQMLEDFTEVISTIRYNSDVRVAILRGEGEMFSYGGYFPEWIGLETHQVRAIQERWLNLLQQWEAFPFPTIASVNGPCWGGAFEWTLACDLVYAVPEAHFNHPEKTLAITTMLGGVYRFAERAGRNVAAEMAYCSKPFTAQRMYELGVVNHIVERDHLDEEVMKVAVDIAEGPAGAHASHKALLRLWSQGGVQAADGSLADYTTPLFGTDDVKRALVSAKDALEGGYTRPILKFTSPNIFR